MHLEFFAGTNAALKSNSLANTVIRSVETIRYLLTAATRE